MNFNIHIDINMNVDITPHHPTSRPPLCLCLREQHVFPLSMLRLHEHEWHQMVGDAWEGLSRQHGEGVAMDADN